MDTLFAMVAHDVGGIPPGRTAKQMRRMWSYQPESSPAPCAYTADVAQLGEPGVAGSSPAVGTN